jgi:hypothetical protein
MLLKISPQFHGGSWRWILSVVKPLDKCLGADGCAEDLLSFTLPWLAMVAGEVG